MTVEDMKPTKYHKSLMIEIESILNDAMFDDINNCDNSNEMWDKLAFVHGGDENVLRERLVAMRGKYNEMRMKEVQNVV